MDFIAVGVVALFLLVVFLIFEAVNHERRQKSFRDLQSRFDTQGKRKKDIEDELAKVKDILKQRDKEINELKSTVKNREWANDALLKRFKELQTIQEEKKQKEEPIKAPGAPETPGDPTLMDPASERRTVPVRVDEFPRPRKNDTLPLQVMGELSDEP